MRQYSTLDFVVKNEDQMLALLNVLSHKYYEQVDGSMTRIFMKMRFRMKLSYEFWRRNCKLSELFYHAIDKTLSEM